MFKGGIYEDPCGGVQDPCLDLTELTKGNFGWGDKETMDVIMDQTAWETWWKANVGDSTAPLVDFTTQMLFAVSMGYETSSGFYPTIDSACIITATDQLEIIVTRHMPGPSCITLPVITHPYAVMSAKKVPNAYYWTVYDDVYDCK
jgi:hypothetical protein